MLTVVNNESNDRGVWEQKFLQGLKDLSSEQRSRPLTFSAAFLCYRLRIDPVFASEHLADLVETATEAFNQESGADQVTHEKQDTDFLLTVNRRN